MVTSRHDKIIGTFCYCPVFCIVATALYILEVPTGWSIAIVFVSLILLGIGLSYYEKQLAKKEKGTKQIDTKNTSKRVNLDFYRNG